MMKKPLLAVLGVAGACAACCAIPLAIPLLGGLSLAGAGLWSWGMPGASPGMVSLVAAALAGIALAGRWLWRRRGNACPATPQETCATQPAARACGVGQGAAAPGCGCAAVKT